MNEQEVSATKSNQDYEAELLAANEKVYKHSLELARLKQALEEANAQQENLLHFMSHEIKGYLTKSEAGFAAIVEGDYGQTAEPLKLMAKIALEDVRKGVRTVMEILDASNFKKGTVAFNKAPFDLKAAVLAEAEAQRTIAEQKHLQFSVLLGDGDFLLDGDEEKIRHHVIRNLIDNAIKYTPKGEVTIQLSRTESTIRFSVKDSGVGITPEDMARLFTEGGRGKDSIKVNVHSTGYGLYIAKEIVDAHGGKIWAESPGGGSGATFIAQFPAAQ